MAIDVDASRLIALDVSADGVRGVNRTLHSFVGTDALPRVLITSPSGRHSIAAGLDAALDVEIDGHVGYYCAGMNKLATVRVRGNCGVGVAENMMSGAVLVEGSASQSAGSSAHGGLLSIGGSAAARCGISLKGGAIVVRGSVGHMSGFMAQSGALVVCGDAGEALGDSLYEARLYVRGAVASLGADCVEKDMRAEHLDEVAALLERARIDDVEASSFRRYGSARRLYHFTATNAY
jgi:methylamine---glutamate N-methyltransferase subunit B